MQVLPGFDGYHRQDRWLPLQITLTDFDRDMSGEVVVEIQDNKTGDRQIYSLPVSLFRTSGNIQYLYVLPESFRRNLQIKLIDDSGRTILQKDASLTAISPADTLVASIGRSGSGLEFLASTTEQGDLSAAEAKPPRIYVSQSTAELLPDKWKGYDSVDVIVLGDVSVSEFSGGQQQAIADWVYDGGSLIVSGGVNSQALIGTSVERLLPVKLNGTRVLDSIYSLSPQFSGAKVVVATSELVHGGKAIAIEENGLPIIARKEVGKGNVTFLAFDYLDPVLRTWNGKEELWRTLIPLPVVRIRPGEAGLVRLLSTGGSARLPSYKLVGIFLFFYVLCFGPLNYLILRKTGKSQLVWITMPVISAIFTIGSLSFVYAARGRAIIVNDLSVANVYQGTQRVQISSYFSLLLTVRDNYRIKFPELEGIFAGRIQYSGVRKAKKGDCRLVEEDGFQIEILDMDIVSPQMFYGESYTDISGAISLNLFGDSAGIAQGEVASSFPFDITDCYVFSDGHRSYVGDLAPGDRAQVRLDETYIGNIPDFYSMRSGEKKQVINALGPGLSRRIHGTGLVGWVNESALEALGGMDIGEEYKALGKLLIIVHL